MAEGYPICREIGRGIVRVRTLACVGNSTHCIYQSLVLYRFYRICHYINTAYQYVNARGHQSTASLLSILCQQRMSRTHIITGERGVATSRLMRAPIKIFVNLQVLHNRNRCGIIATNSVDCGFFCVLCVLCSFPKKPVDKDQIDAILNIHRERSAMRHKSDFGPPLV